MSAFLQRSRLAESILLALFVGGVVALLIPSGKWVSDGSIRLPIRIFVFDAAGRRPIANAECAVFWSPPVLDENNSVDRFPSGPPIDDLPKKCRGVTDATGFCVIEYTFATSASHDRPHPHAFLMNDWVRVEAAGYGGVVVPVRYEERLASELRKEGQVLLSIGLIPKE
jgi:hypothetical protein